MKIITGLSEQPKQQSTLVLADGTRAVWSLSYVSQQTGWFYDLSWNGTVVATGQRMVSSPNILRQYINKISFGIAVVSPNQLEPTTQTALVDGTVTCYLLEGADLQAIETTIFNAPAGQVQPVGSTTAGLPVVVLPANWGPAGGDLAYAYPNPQVVAMHDGTGQRLAFGTVADNQFLKRVGATVVGATVAPGTGDVTGPASSTIGNVALWADAAGTEIADGGTLGTAAFLPSSNFLGATASASGDLSGNYPSPNVAAIHTTTGGGTKLTIGAVADGEFLVRSGSTLIGSVPSGAGDVFGPSSTVTVGTVALFATTDGKTLGPSAITLGTIASQAASNVTITGGSIAGAAITAGAGGTINGVPINGSTIGAITASTGRFSSVTSTGSISAATTITATGNIGAANFSGSSSGTNTGDQTTITGNAATATALANARTIGGSSFNGTANVTSFPVPGPIGGTTPSTGAFTAITATETITATGNIGAANFSGSSSGTNTGNQTISINGDVTAAGSTGALTSTVTRINGTSLAGLATGILKNTTSTGVPSIAVAADFPTLNQNTTGNAATATALAGTPTIGGSSFNGTANVTSFPSPGPIGGTTPNTGAFTTLGAKGLLTVVRSDSNNSVQLDSETGEGHLISINPNSAAFAAFLIQGRNNVPTTQTYGTFTSTGLNSTAIGATTPSTVAATSLSATGEITANTNILLKSGNDLRLYNTVNDAFSQLYNPGGSGAHQLAVRLNGTNISTFTSAGLAVTGAIGLSNADTLTWGGAYGAGIPSIIGSTGAGELQFRPTGSTGGTVGTFSSTGLAITGSLSTTVEVSSASLTSNRFAINSNPINTASTAQSFVRFQTTGADFYLGTESSTGGNFFPGSTAYAAVLYNARPTPMQFYTDGTIQATLSSAGLATTLTNSTGLPLTTGVTGTLPVANGGTGLTTYAIGDLLYASAATTLAKLADVAAGNALISGGVGVAPAWGKIGLPTHITGTLPIGNGGTGLTALGTAGQVLRVKSDLSGLEYATAGSGTITAVTGTAPVSAVTTGTTVAVSMAAATTTVNGYLTATDWTTFNGKQAPITLTTTGTSGAATFTSNTLNIPQYGGIAIPTAAGNKYARLGRNIANALTSTTDLTWYGPDVFNITDYGASPSASAATNTAAIVAAFAAANTAGTGCVYVPQGIFNCNKITVTLTAASKVALMGSGQSASFFKFDCATVSDLGLKVTLGGISTNDRCTFEIQDLTFWARSSAGSEGNYPAGNAVEIIQLYPAVMHFAPTFKMVNCWIRSDCCGGFGYWSNGVSMSRCHNYLIDNCWISGKVNDYVGYGVYYQDEIVNGVITNCQLNYWYCCIASDFRMEGLVVVNNSMIECNICVRVIGNLSGVKLRSTALFFAYNNIDKRGSTEYCLYLNNLSHATIIGNLLLGETGFATIFAQRVFESQINDNSFEAGDSYGIIFCYAYTFAATALEKGVTYVIETLGDTNFTLIGASSNTVGVTFIATGEGLGTGTAKTANTGLGSWANTVIGNTFRGPATDVIIGLPTDSAGSQKSGMITVTNNRRNGNDGNTSNDVQWMQVEDNGVNNLCGESNSFSTVRTLDGSTVFTFDYDITSCQLGRKPNGVAISLGSEFGSNIVGGYDVDNSTKTSAKIKIWRTDGSALPTYGVRFNLCVNP